jgi:hypothetical protein
MYRSFADLSLLSYEIIKFLMVYIEYCYMLLYMKGIMFHIATEASSAFQLYLSLFFFNSVLCAIKFINLSVVK